MILLIKQQFKTGKSTIAHFGSIPLLATVVVSKIVTRQ